MMFLFTDWNRSGTVGVCPLNVIIERRGEPGPGCLTPLRGWQQLSVLLLITGLYFSSLLILNWTSDQGVKTRKISLVISTATSTL